RGRLAGAGAGVLRARSPPRSDRRRQAPGRAHAGRRARTHDAVAHVPGCRHDRRGGGGGRPRAHPRLEAAAQRGWRVSVERSDEEMVLRLIERSRLLVAISEEIPVATKLQVQPLLKQLEDLITDEQPDLDRICATHAQLERELAESEDLTALLGAMRTFLP